MITRLCLAFDVDIADGVVMISDAGFTLLSRAVQVKI